jgi:hypothetical protein
MPEEVAEKIGVAAAAPEGALKAKTTFVIAKAMT